MLCNLVQQHNYPKLLFLIPSFTGRKQELGNQRKLRGEDSLLFGT